MIFASHQTNSPRRHLWSLFLLSPLLIAQAHAQSDAGFGVTRGVVMRLASGITKARDQVWAVLTSLPRLPGDLAKVLQTIFSNAPDGGIAPLLLAAGVCVLLALAPRGLGIVKPLARLRPATPARSFMNAGRRMLFDVINLVAMLVLAVLLVNGLFTGDTLMERFSLALIESFIRAKLAMFIPLALFRPGEASLRLIPASDTQVARALPFVWATVIVAASFITFIPILFEAGIPAVHDGVQGWLPGRAFATLTGLAVGAGGLMAVERFFSAAEPARPRLHLAMRGLVFIFWAGWSYGVISLDFDFYYAFVGLSILAAVTLLADRFLSLSTERGEDEEEEDERSAVGITLMAYAGALCRCVRVAAFSIALVLLARYLLSRAFVMFSDERWANIEGGVVNALLYVVVGYTAFEFLRVWVKLKFGLRDQAMVPGVGEEEDQKPASRLTTVMPLVQGFVGVAILGIAIIAALSELGVNITPLLAGAGIFGLAISFGSQSLVRDIVAGIFYMFDDAFRIGEYIEAGRLRGTVERISLRSLRVRHQNGQMHTIPFGQLGSITNHSRDWITVKFNLRFAGDTDIDKVRKLVKRIGQDMLGDPEIGREFLLPLKMQGVSDVVESSLLLRFKFTVRPGKPTIVQREALKKMVLAFREQNIRFATPAVSVQAIADGSADMSAAAAGTVMINAAKAAAEQAAAGS